MEKAIAMVSERRTGKSRLKGNTFKKPNLEINANKATYVIIYFEEDKKTCAKQVIKPSVDFIRGVRGGKATWGDLVRAVVGSGYETFDLK